MELELTELDGPLTCARLHGRLDTAGSDQIGLRFTAGVVAPGRPALIDLSDVSFISSMGIRLLISCAKGLRGKGASLVLFGAQPAVQEVFEQSALDQVFDLAPDEVQALARVAG